MASLDGSRASESLSSDEQFQLECDVCKEDGQTREATSYCSDCVEYYCASCVQSHKRMKATRNHSILSGTDIPKTAPAKQRYLSVMYCNCSHSLLVEFFCEDHNDVCCSDCRLISHRNCRITAVDKKCTSSIEDDLNIIIQQTNDIEKKAQDVQELYTTCHESISESEAKCNVKIKAFSEQLQERIRTVTQKADAELKKHIKEESKLIEIQEEQCKRSLQRLAKDKQVLQEAKNTGDKRQMLVSVLKISPIIVNCHQLVDDLKAKCKPTSIDFVENNALEDVQNTDTSLGQLIVSGQSTTGRTSCNVLNMNVNIDKSKDVTPFNAKRQTGSALLPNGDLVISDCDANTLILLDPLFKLKFSTSVSRPWDVAPLNDKEIVVTLPIAKKLQFVKTESKLELGRYMEIGENCYGVDILNNEIFVSCASGDKTVRIFDIGGTLKRKVGLMQDGKSIFANPLHLAVSQKSSKLFVSDWINGKTICFSSDGSVLQTYSDANLSHPRGILLDDQNDNLLVCNDDDANSVISVYKADSSKRNRTLLTCKENIKNTYSISYRESDKTLIVVCKENVLAFKL